MLLPEPAAGLFCGGTSRKSCKPDGNNQSYSQSTDCTKLVQKHVPCKLLTPPPMPVCSLTGACTFTTNRLAGSTKTSSETPEGDYRKSNCACRFARPPLNMLRTEAFMARFVA